MGMVEALLIFPTHRHSALSPRLHSLPLNNSGFLLASASILRLADYPQFSRKLTMLFPFSLSHAMQREMHFAAQTCSAHVFSDIQTFVKVMVVICGLNSTFLVDASVVYLTYLPNSLWTKILVLGRRCKFMLQAETRKIRHFWQQQCVILCDWWSVAVKSITRHAEKDLVRAAVVAPKQNSLNYSNTAASLYYMCSNSTEFCMQIAISMQIGAIIFRTQQETSVTTRKYGEIFGLVANASFSRITAFTAFTH